MRDPERKTVEVLAAPLGAAGSGLVNWYGFEIPDTAGRSPIVGVVRRSGFSLAVHQE